MTTAKNNRQQDELRISCRRARADLSSVSRDEASTRICDTVIRAGFFRRSRNVACYLPSDVEVDTWPIIARAFTMGKQVSAPVLRKNGSMGFRVLDSDSELLPNQFGLLEPQDGEFIDPHHLDIVITPLVAFDAVGNRVGMGSGYFDRAFSFLRTRRTWLHPKLIGVAFECQRVKKITPNPWDIGLFRVFTETS
jgi:5-formyltetrahydrofolate cyclo-ligase